MGLRRTPLLNVVDPAQVSSGIVPDRHDIGKPLWEAAENVRFYDGKVRRRIPASVMFTGLASAPARGLHQQQLGSGVRWAFGSFYNEATDGVSTYRWYGPAPELVVSQNEGAAHLDASSLYQPTYIDFTTWGDWTIINSGIGPATLFKPGVSTAALPGAPEDVVQFLKRQNQLVAVGHGGNLRGVSVSNSDDITNWTEAAETNAWSGSIEELDTPIRAGNKLGPNIACYAEDQLGLVYWVGSPYYFGQRVALDGIGAVGKAAVCADGPYNYGVSRNGCWRTDGSSYQYIDQGILNDYLQANVNWDQGAKIVCSRNDVTRCIEFYFPMGSNTEASEGWSFDPQTGGWGPLPGYQLAMERKLFDKPLLAKDGQVLLADDNEGAEAALVLRTKALLMQTPSGAPMHEGSMVDELQLLVKEASNVEVRIGVSEDLDGTFDWSSWKTVVPDLTTYQWRRPSGVFHKLELRSTAVNWSLDLQGFVLYGQPEGTKRTSV